MCPEDRPMGSEKTVGSAVAAWVIRERWAERSRQDLSCVLQSPSFKDGLPPSLQ